LPGPKNVRKQIRPLGTGFKKVKRAK